MVPHWERGAKESARVVSKKARNHDLHVCAIGGSVATPGNGITAEVVEVKNFEQLKSLGREKIEGKIVFFNRAADPAPIYTFEAYGGAVDQRTRGAMHAARFGAVGVIVRSVTHAHDNNPHTGIQHYADSVKAIPAMVAGTNDADSLSLWLKKDPALKLSLQTSCILHPEVQSYNIIAEIRGSELPREVIAFGGHLDSWDIGQGAHDDGAGVVQTIEVLRIFKTLNIRPRHTLRVVVFMDEEYDQRGAHAYAAEAIKRSGAGAEKHLAAIEADGHYDQDGAAIIERIETTEGRVVYSRKKLKIPVVDARISAAISNILQNVIPFGTGKYAGEHVRLQSSDPARQQVLTKMNQAYPLLGKTGTANDYRNAAFIGYVPVLSSDNQAILSLQGGYTVGVYTGYDTNQPMVKGATRVSGSLGALPAWSDIAQSLLNVEKIGDRLDAVDLTFNGLALQYPDVKQVFVPVDPRQGGAVVSGSPALRQRTPPSRPASLGFGEITESGRFEPERLFVPFWKNR
jgi:hypothetical protein